ncbi:nuclear transport factor 2 family protein [uncultured Roseobacter sp.]|uniref:nuclear transport factor 2 family protein n=1 Tax=uncultured Roseobacter sp. TaxID=114847 RepID=UPI0026190462|nr:nuclear transport factor 2 family protein [uncultured Roseobacter sp.]
MDAEKIIRIIVNAYQERDLETVLEFISDDIVFINNADPDSAPHCARVSNKEEFVAYLKEIDECWDIQQFQINQLLVNGDDVATRSLMDYVSKNTGRRVVTQGAHFWTVKESKVIRIHEFYDTAAIGARK